MKKISGIISIIVVTLLILSALYKYNVFVQERDFFIVSEVSCDPSVESCFVWDCDPLDEECDQTPYKYISKNASKAPLCDVYSDDSCPEELYCEEDEVDCEYFVCSDEEVGEEEFCTDLI